MANRIRQSVGEEPRCVGAGLVLKSTAVSDCMNERGKNHGVLDDSGQEEECDHQVVQSERPLICFESIEVLKLQPECPNRRRQQIHGDEDED